MADKTQGNWTEPQLKYIHFLARGKKNKSGEHRTEQQFADTLGVDFATLWRWKQKDGFGAALLEATQKELQPLLPSLSRAVSGKAFGQKGFKQIDVPAANLAIKLMGVTLEKRDIKQEVTGTMEHSFAGVPEEKLDEIIETGANV